MKKAIIVLIVLFGGFLPALSQNYAGRMNDEERIAIQPKIPVEVEVSGQARNLLLSRMNNVINLNGLAASEDMSYFAMVPQVTVLTEDITPTAPPMHAITVLISFSIVDNFSGNVFGETSLEVKGVDRSRERAYTQAFSSLNPRAGQLKVFMERSKEKILEFYNSDCDRVIATAQSLVEQDRKYEAIQLLESVPRVSAECFDVCMKMAGEIGPTEDPNLARANPEQDSNPDENPSEVNNTRFYKLRTLEIELVDVEYTGTDLDVTLLFTDNDLNRDLFIRSARFFDKNGNEEKTGYYGRRLDLIRNIPKKYVITFKGDNLDLVKDILMLELNFDAGTARFDNLKVN